MFKPLTLLPLTIVALCCALGSARAQVIVRPFYYGGTWSGPLIVPEMEEPARLPRAILFEAIRDQGFRPLGILGRTRDTVTLEAIDYSERRFRLIVDAFDGEVLSRRPIASAEPPRQSAPRPETPPQRRKAQGTSPAATPPVTKPPAATPPAAPAPQKPAPASEGPVAPARDPSQWGKAG